MFLIFKEMYSSEINDKWNITLDALSNIGDVNKRFDFVVKTDNSIFGIETNFYRNGGSKLNETARSYKALALESEEISNFIFVWITDGGGWKDAQHNLKETFDVTDYIYNIYDMENGILEDVLK